MGYQVGDYRIEDCESRREQMMFPGVRHRPFSGARVTHLPTGTAAKATSSRHFAVNRGIALRLLASRVAHVGPKSAEVGPIRTYRNLPRSLMATDHRSGITVPTAEAMEGRIGSFLGAT